MDFLTFTNGISIKPYQSVEVKPNQAEVKIKTYSNNPLLDFIVIHKPMKSDPLDKNFEELIHNAQVAKRWENSTIQETNTLKIQSKPRWNYRNAINRNAISLTPYQKYEQEKKLNLGSIKIKKEISDVNKCLDANKTIQLSLLPRKRRVIILPNPQRVKFYQNQRNEHKNSLFLLFNGYVTDFNKTTANTTQGGVTQTAFNIKKDRINSYKKHLSLFNSQRKLTSPMKYVNRKRKLKTCYVIKGYSDNAL